MKIRHITLAPLTSIALIGCLDDAARNPMAVNLEVAAPAQERLSHIDPLMQFAERIAGFAGAAFGADGDFVISLISPSFGSQAVRSSAEDAFLTEHGSDFFTRRDGAPVSFRFEHATFSYRELAMWRDQALALWGLPGVHSVDLDEVRNVIAFKVDGADQIAPVFAAGVRSGVPPAALVVEVRPRAEFRAKLTDKIRPFPGGVQVQHQSKGACTAAFVATRSQVKGFVTNSHCSPTFGWGDTGWFGQPGTDGNHWVGPEALDPAFSVLPDCPQGHSCRFSDASFVAETFAASSSSLGKIARTGARCRTSCQSYRTIVGNFDVIGESPASYAGQELQKVGITTGWTYGYVTETCVVEAVPNLSNRSLVCQYWLSAGSSFGDSGSPVFHWNGSNGATIHGVMWGGAGGETVFSPMAGVESDLGSLTTN